MAVLNNNIYDNMQSMIDFSMNDRSGDGNMMLNDPGINEQRRLNIHIILATDNVIDKVL